jgi:hypothetical protein
MNKVFGLVGGQHALFIPVEGHIFTVEEYIFDDSFDENSHDYQATQSVIADKLSEMRFTQDGGFSKVTVHVTVGLTPAVVELIKYCLANFIVLDFLNFDRKSGQYIQQSVLRESQFSPLAFDYGMDGL